MEPIAPGTEEDSSSSFPSISKQESEQERLLSQKTRLANGSYGYVFELNFYNGAEHWYCNVCECPIMGRVYHHEIGKRHTCNMAAREEPQKMGDSQKREPEIQVAPGEPVPPGFEGEIEKQAKIQQRLNEYKVGPLVGLEYLLEIQSYEEDKEPSYLCLLCDKRGDPRTVIAHLASYNHISQYLQKHFPTCYRTLAPFITKQYKRNWQNVMQKIAEAIEAKFGRLKPHPVDYKSFQENRTAHEETVFRSLHFTEKSGYTFVEIIDKEELTKPLEPTREDGAKINKLPEDMSKRFYRKTGSAPGAGDPTEKRSPSPPAAAPSAKQPKVSQTNRRSLSSVSSISSNELSDFEPEKEKNLRSTRRSKSRERRRSRSRSRSPLSRRYSGRNIDRSPSRRSRDRDHRSRRSPLRGTLPWQRPDYIKNRGTESSSADKRTAKGRSRSPGKLDEYKKLAAAIESDMGRILRQHEKNPEKHPQYNDEWKKFWNKRYKELQAEGKDAQNHDFKPEWIVFWNKRMVELHNIEVKTKKDALRKRLGLPDEPAPICFRITGKKPPPLEEKPKDGKRKDRSPSNEVIVIDDKEDDVKEPQRSHSPWESDPISPPKRSRSPARRRGHSRDRSPVRRRDGSRDRRSYRRDRSVEKSKRRSRDRDVRSREREARSKERDVRSKDKESGRLDRDGVSRDREMRYHPSEKAWEREMHYSRMYQRDIPDAYKPPRVMRDVTRQPVHSPPAFVPAAETDAEDDGEINVVGVLRLLTALEEKLGSLGPKVIDLLAQALAMEKNEANSSETLLDNEVNCVMFETVKEKLKGQLLAGLVEYNQEKAFKNAIKKTASLIHVAGERKKEKEKSKADPVKVPGVGTIDKAAIAKQIATALVLQGKTDVTQAELEQLINAVVGMAEASRNSNKPVTTAAFMEQLSKQQQPTTTPTPTEDKVEKPKSEQISFTLQALQHETFADTSSMDGLSDSDLQTLLQNFKDLSTQEQHGLISYLKKLEAKEPERVERLRKFVNLGATAEVAGVEAEKKETGRTSPFSARLSGGNPMVEKKSKVKDMFADFDEEEEAVSKNETQQEVKMTFDSEDEEYSYEDVFKAATKNVEAEKERKDEEKKKEANDIKDAKAIIANLMGSFNAIKNNVPNTATPTEEKPKETTQKFGNISMNFDNLNSIVGNINKTFPEPQKQPETSKPQPQNYPQNQNRPTNNNYNPITPPSQQHHQQHHQQYGYGMQRPYDMFADPRPQHPPQPVQYPIRPPGSGFINQRPPPMQNVQYPIRPNAGGGFGNFGPGYGRGGPYGGNNRGRW